MPKSFSDFLPNAFLAGVGAFLEASVDDVFVSVFGAESRWKWNARTSGIVLVASVGSYCAYRICSKYLGDGFVWTLLDSTRLDRIPRADSRLLHPAAEGFFYPRRTGEGQTDEGHRKLASLKATPSSNYRISATRSGSPIRILCNGEGLRKRPSRKGLEGISSSSQKKSISTRVVGGLGEELDNADARSDLTSISRVVPASSHSNAIYDVDGDMLDELPDEYPSSSQCSVKYAESEMGWEEDSFTHGFCAQNPCFSGSPTPSDISNLSCVRNLKRLLQEKGDHSTTASVILEKLNSSNTTNFSDCEDNTSGLLDIAEMIQSKCSAQNVQYMYESVHLGDTATFDAMSVLSFQSSSSFRKLGKSKGLYDLTGRPSPTPSTYSRRSSMRFQSPLASTSHSAEKSDPVKPTIITVTDEEDPKQKNVMTDSCFSRSSVSSTNHGPYRRSTMFDSGLSTDFTSEDDRSSVGGYAKAYSAEQTGHKTWLDKIIEQSPSNSPKHHPHSVFGSMASLNISNEMEWEDDPALRDEGTEV
ncbi:unnamed protein product [Bursaphelenchus xylophilus]|uniref:(pine wood nematode) hypothetical protein n=1 Tax=Bursaphelenchus xylophilus TaxID=6326 RepID=A0A1I7RTL1_BURXY|nr:unnamed protein product [Bursaphelenchus xylophilus]CAG9122359.1 unnamed protein product [Bursaphelenchus xylophilus]